MTSNFQIEKHIYNFCHLVPIHWHTLWNGTHHKLIIKENICCTLAAHHSRCVYVEVISHLCKSKCKTVKCQCTCKRNVVLCLLPVVLQDVWIQIGTLWTITKNIVIKVNFKALLVVQTYVNTLRPKQLLWSYFGGLM